MSLLGRIMNASNAFFNVTNIQGSQTNPGASETTFLPLGTPGASATGEVGIKVVVVGSTSGGSSGTLITTGPISTTGTATTVSVLSTTTPILAANAARKYVAICNNGTNDVFLIRGATAISGAGIILKASGGSYEINSTNLYLGAISGISASANNVSVEEDT